MKQKQLKTEYMRSLAQTHEAADASLKQAYDTIHCLQGTVHQQEIYQAELHRQVHDMRTALDNQSLHLNVELDSVQKKHESDVQQIQAQQAQQARELQRTQMERESAWNREIAKLTAALEQPQAQEQLQ